MLAIRRLTIRRIITIVVVGLCATVAGATQSRPVNLEQMTERAATIFAGRCVDVRVEADPAFGGDVTVATFRVHRYVKGGAGGTISVRMPAPSAAAAPAGVPSYARGDEVILFLYGESATGMRAPVGLGQGRFRVLADKLGHPLAINDFGNRNLMRGLSAGAQRHFAGASGFSDEKSLNPRDLLDAVESLLGAQR